MQVTVETIPKGNAVIKYDRTPARPLCVERVEGVRGAFIIRDLLTPCECQQYIDLTEEKGYSEALITTLSGMVSMPDVRDNYRLMLDFNSETLAPIWQRAKPFLPSTWQGNEWDLCGLNERFRFYRYDVGQSFKPHYDGCFARDVNTQSHLTFIIYLNDDFEGGETTFFVRNSARRAFSLRTEDTTRVPVRPRQGSALVFPHTGNMSPLHEGSTPTAGRKYALRSDVMYQRRVPKVVRGKAQAP